MCKVGKQMVVLPCVKSGGGDPNPSPSCPLCYKHYEVNDLLVSTCTCLTL